MIQAKKHFTIVISD